MNLILQYESSALAAPQSFRDSMQTAANILDAAIDNNITVTILVGYGDIMNGQYTEPADRANGWVENGINVSYTSLRAALASHESSPVDVTFVNSLPSTASIDGHSAFYVPSAIAESLGLMAGPSSGIDGAVGFGTGIPTNYLVEAALHELTHAIGRNWYGTFHLLRYTSPGVHLYSQSIPAPPAYFSIDGGYTKLADFGQTSDPTDFLNTGIQGADPFNEFVSGVQSLTSVDLKLLDALGFDVTGVVAGLSVHNYSNATHGQQINLSTLLSIADPNNYGYQKLELWDSSGTAAGGQFIVNGIPQTGGHEIDVAPADIGNTVFAVGSGNGTDTLWARILQNNGTLSDWQKFSIALQVPTLTVHNDASAARLQTVSLSTLETISDPNGLGYQKLELWDSNGTAAGGRFVVNGVAQTGGHEIDVTPADVANTVFDAGTAGGTDILWARLLENDGTLTSWQQFSVTVPPPTLSVTSIPSASRGQLLSVSSLATISDPSNVGYQKLELWDSNGTVTGGQFVVNGVAQTGGYEIDVTPANVASTVFDVGTAGGTDTLWARLLQNDGTLTAWQQFTVAAPLDHAPVATASNVTAMHGQTSVTASSLFSASDADGDTITQYALWDTNGNGHWVVNGAVQATNAEIDITAAQLAQTSYQFGSAPDQLWVRAYDGVLWGAWVPFTTSPGPDHLPIVAASDFAASHGQNLAASSLFTVTDADNDTITNYQLWDSTSDPSSGHWVVGGASQGTNVAIDVSAAQLASTSFQSGSGSDDLWVRAYDGFAWGAWKEFHVNAPVDHAPVVSASDFSATHGQNIAASSLFSVSDVDGDTITAFRFWDSTSDPASGHFVVGGLAQGTNQNIDVTAAQLASTTFQSGSGSDDLWVQAYDGFAWGAWKEFHVNAPVDHAPVVTAANTTSTANQTVAASSLFSATDADNDSMVKYQFWDSTADPNSGHWTVGGVTQGTNQAIDVTAAQLASTAFQTGTVSDDLWVRANDGVLWSQWQEFHVLV